MDIAEISDVNHTVIIADDGTVVVALDGRIGGKTFSSTGTAKLDPKDKFDEQIGLELAYGRALRKLGQRLLAEGNRGVHEKDKARKRQQEASAIALKAKKKASKKARKAAKAKLKK